MSENITISIDGKAQDGLEYSLVEAVVDTNIFLPAMFTLVIQDDYDAQKGSFEYIDSTSVFDIGKEVKIEIDTDEIYGESSNVKATLIIGEITSIEPSFGSDGIALLCVRGYDRSYQLTQGKKTRTFINQASDEQVVKAIVGEAPGLTGSSVDSSVPNKVKSDYVMQYNQSNWDFLWSRARLIGYQVYVEDKKLFFQKADKERGDGNKPAKLVWGMNLDSFEPRLSVMGQLAKVNVKSWDLVKKEVVEQSSSSVSDKNVPETGVSKQGTALMKSTISAKIEDHVVDIPLETTNHAKEIAHSRHMAAESGAIKAEGQCREGDPRLIAGKKVEIENVGKRFGGTYYVTEARHEWVGGQYFVRFNVSGYNPYTIQELMGKEEAHPERIWGVVTGKVTSQEDPENLGRVKVMFPWLPKDSGSDMESNWARLASAAAGKERGFLFAPEIDDEVLVAFEHGDMSRPFIVGVLWNKTDKPPEGTAKVLADGKVNQRVICSRSGHLIVLDDTDGKEKIVVQDKTSKNSITIDSSDNSMTIKSAGDLTMEAGGKFILKSKGDFSVDSKAKTTIKSQSDLSLDSMQKALMKCTSNELSLQMAGAALKGTQVEITGNAKTSVKGSAMVEIQGALVKIN